MTQTTDRLNAALAGRYRIERELGQGGMATVYLADDLKHDRKVAIKVLKPELAAVVGSERFLAEIKTTANLQHPSILPLFDSGDADGFLFYVMPYVEGQSLREKLDAEKQLRVADALDLTRKVADALDYAHGKGVVHRDIKPANILLSERGEPLVADFGIALAVSQAGGGRITETGLSLGTPHYMSPEQATGDRDVDPRSDVYALGCVLYEMLAGQPPFHAPTAQAVLARILTEPARSVSELRRTVPHHVGAVLAKALEKLPADRFESAEEFRDALSDEGFRYEVASGGTRATAAAPEPTPLPQPRKSGGRLLVAAAGVGLVALVGGTLIGRSLAPGPSSRSARFVIPPPDSSFVSFRCCGRAFALSPDGSELVFLEGAGGPAVRRRLDGLETTVIPGTDDARIPFYSPDGLWLGYEADGQLRKVPLGGGPSVPIIAGDRINMASWGDNDTIVFAQGGDLFRVPAAGGAPAERVLPEAGLSFTFPHVLPGSEAVLVSIDEGAAESWLVGTVDLVEQTVDTIGFGVRAEYAAGHLLYVGSEGTLLVQPFDLDALETTGQAVAMVEGVRRSGAGVSAEFAAARNTGDLVYFPTVGGASGNLETLVRDTGAGPVEIPFPTGEPENVEGMAYSPDGSRIAVGLPDRGTTVDLWVFDVGQNTLTRVTEEGSRNRSPVWTPDGERITFTSDRGDGEQIFWRRWDLSEPAEQIFESGDLEVVRPMAWLADGQTLLFVGSDRDLPFDIGLWTLGDSTPRWVVSTTTFWEAHAQVSPDGEWLAYTSDRSGESEVYLQALDGSGGSTQISTQGGASPHWGLDRQTLYYVTGGTLTEARLQTEPTVRVLERTRLPVELVDLNYPEVHYDVHPTDGSFLYLTRQGSGGSSGEGQGLVWILDWPSVVGRMQGNR